LEKEYPRKVKVFKYLPIVYPPNSKEYLSLPETSVHSLVYYYNYALSQTSMTHCFKFDDDEIFFPNTIRNLKLRIDSSCAIGVRGINLVDYKEQLYVNSNNLFTSGKDTLFFFNNENCYFSKNNNYEEFNHTFKFIKIETLFYHTKNCKKDRGINNYLLNTNLKSRYLKINTDWFTNLKLIKIEDFFNKFGKYISPFDLNFKFINNSIKIYDYEKMNELENNILLP
jgi:hypothetical protein